MVRIDENLAKGCKATQKLALKLTPKEQAEKEQLISEGKLPQEINRSLDLYFRFLLGTPGRTELLIDVLNSVFVPLGHPKIKDVKLRPTELAPIQNKLRHARLDILADDETGRRLNLEIQTWNDTFFPERLALYNGRLLDFQTIRGKKLDVLRQTCSIALLAYNMFRSAKDKNCAVWDFMLRDPTGEKVLTDKMWIILVEMPKLRTQGDILPPPMLRIEAGASRSSPSLDSINELPPCAPRLVANAIFAHVH